MKSRCRPRMRVLEGSRVKRPGLDHATFRRCKASARRLHAMHTVVMGCTCRRFKAMLSPQIGPV